MKLTLPSWRSRRFDWGMQRWDAWLRARLSPALVARARVGAKEDCLWNVEFPWGGSSVVRVPRSLVDVDLDDFERITTRMRSRPWESELQDAGPEGLTLACPQEAPEPGTEGIPVAEAGANLTEA